MLPCSQTSHGCLVLQCVVKYDIVGDGRAVELFSIEEDTGVITLTRPFTIDDAILYKVCTILDVENVFSK